MRAGRLRHKVIVQQPNISTKDTLGDITESWTQYVTQWASVSPLRGRELEVAQQRYGEVTHEIVTREEKLGITPDMRVLWKKADSAVGLAISTTGTAVQVASADEFPRQGPFRIQVEDEIMQVTAGWGTTALTATRGMDGTSASTHNLATKVHVLGVANILDTLNVDERDIMLRHMAAEVV